VTESEILCDMIQTRLDLDLALSEYNMHLLCDMLDEAFAGALPYWVEREAWKP
jgi:hypothetical protein